MIPYPIYLCTIIQKEIFMTQQPTMRALLQREITQQERYIKDMLTSLHIPFHKYLHFRVSKAYTTFSVKLKKSLTSRKLVRIKYAFFEGRVIGYDSFIGKLTQEQFIEIQLPNQNSYFFRLEELLNATDFSQHKGTLPIALGLNDQDLCILDLATTKHISIESDQPSYRYKLQQLFLHSLLTSNNYKQVQIAWIEEPLEHPELRSRITSFMLTEANQAETVLPIIIQENEKRKAENSFETRWVIFVSDAYTTYHRYKDLFNALENSQAQGIHLIGFSECLDKDTMTVKELVEYNSLFTPSLWMDAEGRLHHERYIIQLPFFTEALPFFHEKGLSLSEHIDELLRRRGETSISIKAPLEPMTFQQVQSHFSSHLLNYHLGNQEGTTELPLKTIYAPIKHTYRKFFMEMIERLCENIIYFIADHPKKLIKLKELRFDPKSEQVLINGEVAYTPTSEGGLIPLFAQSFDELTLYAVPQPITLDHLDEATYPQLHLVAEALKRSESYKKIARRTTPIALLSEIEIILSQVKFQLAGKKEVGEDITLIHKNKPILEGILKLSNKDFAFRLLEIMKDYELIEKNLTTLTDVQACKNLGHTFPILLEADGENSSKDNSGRDRYYPNDLFEYNGKKYYVTNDWYEKTKEKSNNRDNRTKFLEWIRSLLNK